MDESQLFCSLNLPSAAPQPSISTVQWSEDGQLFLATKGVICILTPQLGINYEDLSSTSSLTDKRNNYDSKDGDFILRWYRNVIDFDRSCMCQPWPTLSQEWGALSLGSLDFSWRSVTLSPSNLSRTSGCFMAALNTNLEVSLWCATKNHLREAWIKIQDITAALKALPLSDDDTLGASHERQTYHLILHAQTNCISWSSQADFGLTPNPLVDGSLLALGNRAGSVIIMRSDGNCTVQSIKVIHIADEWITHLAWGPWKITSVGECETFLACGCSNGSIAILRVTQKFVPHADISPLKDDSEIQVDFYVLNTKASATDKRGISALKWIESANTTHTLLYAKPGFLNFYRVEDSGNPDGRELCQLRLKAQRTSACSSSLTPVVGVTHLQSLDALIVTLFDGSFHIVHDVSTLPVLGEELMDLDGGTTGKPTSESISRTARQVFVKAEGGSVQHVDANRTSGMASFDGLGTVLWVHEACRPGDFSYTPDARRNNYIVVSNLLSGSDMSNGVLETIRYILSGARKVLSQSPISILRPVLLHLSRKDVFNGIWQIIPELLAFDSSDVGWDVPVHPFTTSTEVARRGYRQSLRVHLYGWESFQSCRLRLALADFCWKLAPNENIRRKFGEVAAHTLNNISFRFLQVIAKHAIAAMDDVCDKDIRFLMRLVVQSLIDGHPEGLRNAGNELHESLRRKFPSAPDIFNLDEPCPACNAPIPLDDLRNAKCPQGHIWARCSITSFVLSTPMVRTCIGCTRKAFLPPSMRTGNAATALWIPEAGRSWIVDELLEATRVCVYCGNHFVQLL